MKRTITVKAAAELLGVRAEYLRRCMREKTLDIGLAIPHREGIKTSWRYIVSKAKLEKILGEEIADNE